MQWQWVRGPPTPHCIVTRAPQKFLNILDWKMLKSLYIMSYIWLRENIEMVPYSPPPSRSQSQPLSSHPQNLQSVRSSMLSDENIFGVASVLANYSQLDLHILTYRKSCSHRCMGDFFPGASRNDFKPKSKARPNFFLDFFAIFSCRTFRNCCFLTLSSLKMTSVTIIG